MRLTDAHHAQLRQRFGATYVGDTIDSIARDGGRDVHVLLGLELPLAPQMSTIGLGLGDWAQDQIERAVEALRKIVDIEFIARAREAPTDFVERVVAFDKLAARVGVEGALLAAFVDPVLSTLRAVYALLVRYAPGVSLLLDAIVQGAQALFGSAVWAGTAALSAAGAISALFKAGADALFRKIVAAFRRVAALFSGAIYAGLELLAAATTLVHDTLAARAPGVKRAVLRVGYFVYALTSIVEQKVAAKQRLVNELVLGAAAPLVDALRGVASSIGAALIALGDGAATVLAAVRDSVVGALLSRIASAGANLAAAFAWLADFAAFLLRGTAAIAHGVAALVTRLGAIVLEPVRRALGLDMDAFSLFDGEATRPFVDLAIEMLRDSAVATSPGGATLRSALGALAGLDAGVNSALDALWSGDATMSIGTAWRNASLLVSFAMADEELSTQDAAVFTQLLGRSYADTEALYAEARATLLEAIGDVIEERESATAAPRTRRRRVGSEAFAAAATATGAGSRAPTLETARIGERVTRRRGAAPQPEPKLEPAKDKDKDGTTGVRVGVLVVAPKDKIDNFLVRWGRAAVNNYVARFVIATGAPQLAVIANAVARLRAWAATGLDRGRSVRVRSHLFIAMAALGVGTGLMWWARHVAADAHRAEVETLQLEVDKSTILKSAFALSGTAPSFDLLVQDLADSTKASAIHPIAKLNEALIETLKADTDALLRGGLDVAASVTGVALPQDRERAGVLDFVQRVRATAVATRRDIPKASGLDKLLEGLARFDDEYVRDNVIVYMLDYFSADKLAREAARLYSGSKVLQAKTTLDFFQAYMTSLTRAINVSALQRYGARLNEHLFGGSAQDAFNAFTSPDTRILGASVWDVLSTPTVSFSIAVSAGTWLVWAAAEGVSTLAPDPEDVMLSWGSRLARVVREVTALTLELVDWLFWAVSKFAGVRGVLVYVRAPINFALDMWAGNYTKAWVLLAAGRVQLVTDVFKAGALDDAREAAAVTAARCVVCHAPAATACACCERACCTRVCQAQLHAN